jgi:hypothetical protein
MRGGFFLCTVSIVLLLVGDSWARFWRVRPDGSGDAVTIQAGIDSCGIGDTVVAASGTYRGDGNRDLDFKGKMIAVLSEDRYNPAVTDSVVLDCEGSFGNQHHAFNFHSGERGSSIVEGFVIIHGYGARPLYAPLSGGGIVCDSVSSPTIRFNRIHHCVGGRGGGILVQGASAPFISQNEIYANEADEGAGIYCGSSSPVILDNYVHDNNARTYMGLESAVDACLSRLPEWVLSRVRLERAMSLDEGDATGGTPNGTLWTGGTGGGIECDSCSGAIISRNGVAGNYAAWCSGSGILLWHSSATVSDNELYRNGHDALSMYGSIATVCHNHIHDNSGEALQCWDGSSVAIDSNNVHDHLWHPDACTWGLPCIVVADSKALIRWNQVRAGRCGGIWYDGDSTGVIENNAIEGNRYWGGIHCASAVAIVGNTIKGNQSYDDGGGIACSASANVVDNLIVSNRADWQRYGGGLYCGGASPVVTGNTIADNIAGLGAGVYIGAESYPILARNIICNNTRDTTLHSEYGGEGIYSEVDSVDIGCCDVFGNGGGNYVGLLDPSGTRGNISLDPLFCGAIEGNYSLHIQSPCLPGNHPDRESCGLIGARNVGCDYVATLLQGFSVTPEPAAIVLEWRLSAMSEDMRFFVLRAVNPSGGYGEIPAVLLTRDGSAMTYRDKECQGGTAYRYRVDISDNAGRRVLFETDAVTMPAAKLVLFQNYPNPFNPATRISYFLPVRERVRVEIFDVAGRRVADLVDEVRDRGAYVVEWGGTDERGTPVASGLYLCRLTAGKETISRKMVLLK